MFNLVKIQSSHFFYFLANNNGDNSSEIEAGHLMERITQRRPFDRLQYVLHFVTL